MDYFMFQHSLGYIVNQRFLTQGTHTPQGYASRLQGVRQISPFQSVVCIRSGTNCGKGVRKELKSCLGGTQRSKILIQGYASTKRLRTPAVNEYLNSPKKNLTTSYVPVCDESYGNFHKLKTNSLDGSRIQAKKSSLQKSKVVFCVLAFI